MPNQEENIINNISLSQARELIGIDTIPDEELIEIMRTLKDYARILLKSIPLHESLTQKEKKSIKFRNAA